MSDTVFIEDGYTLTDHMPATPGLHGAAVLVYRPALARERHQYGAKISNPETLDKFEVDLIAKYTVSVNEVAIAGDKGKAERLHPVIRARLIDLILSYTAPKEAQAAGNSAGA
jgi:hypothetical protein